MWDVGVDCLQAYSDLLGFILAMSEAVKGKKLRDEYFVSQV